MRSLPIHGRGTSSNPPNRFTEIRVEREDWSDPEGPGPETRLFRDASRSIVTTNDSPDVPFEASVNPYRGCEHGCSYCFARPNHEYLGLSAGIDFETKIFVKEDAPELLRAELASPGWRPKVLAMSGVTDPYQPAERRMRVTRGCLEVLAEARNPVSIITKSHLVTRDIDLLSDLAAFDAVRVTLSVTTLRNEIHRAMEPRAAVPSRRLRAIRELSEAGIPVGVNVAPVVPGLTEHETADILEAAAEAGASRAGYILLRLPFGVKDLFVEWLAHHFPDRRDKVIHRLESMRGGRLNDPRFGSRMKGAGPYADQIRDLFEITCGRLGLNRDDGTLSTTSFRRPRLDGEQISLF